MAPEVMKTVDVKSQLIISLVQFVELNGVLGFVFSFTRFEKPFDIRDFGLDFRNQLAGEFLLYGELRASLIRYIEGDIGKEETAFCQPLNDAPSCSNPQIEQFA